MQTKTLDVQSQNQCLGLGSQDLQSNLAKFPRQEMQTTLSPPSPGSCKSRILFVRILKRAGLRTPPWCVPFSSGWYSEYHPRTLNLADLPGNSPVSRPGVCPIRLSKMARGLPTRRPFPNQVRQRQRYHCRQIWGERSGYVQCSKFPWWTYEDILELPAAVGNGSALLFPLSLTMGLRVGQLVGYRTHHHISRKVWWLKFSNHSSHFYCLTLLVVPWAYPMTSLRRQRFSGLLCLLKFLRHISTPWLALISS